MSGVEHQVVRRNERHDVALRGRFKISPEHDPIVKLSKVSGARDGLLEADIVDLSAGGLGFLSPVFFPKHARITCQIAPGNRASDAFDTQGVVRRVVMTDRRPMYLIGVSFDSITDEASTRLHELLSEFDDGPAPTPSLTRPPA
jgi:hypothetical protein